jgi:predicted phosphoribosyltransferase
LFRTREDAGRKLAAKLIAYKGQNPLILAIPRGSVSMASVIANALGGELDVVLVHKLGHPANEEFAVGAVDEDGQIYVDELVDTRDVTHEYLEMEADIQLRRLKRRREMYTPVRSQIDPKGRVVIIVDDGIATGWTLKAAIRATKQKGPKKLIIAAGVGSPDSVAEIAKTVDEMVCLHAPRDFQAVGQFYDDFAQVSDEEVVEILARKVQ